jgi:hypothetical protein
MKTWREENADPQCWQYSCSGFGSFWACRCGPESVIICTYPNPSINKQKIKKTLELNYFATSLSLKSVICKCTYQKYHGN